MNTDALHSATAGFRRPGPIRTCVGCRGREQATGLLRVVAADGALVPDPRRRLPGRGAWVHPVPECLDRAERRSAFSRALRVREALDVAPVRSYVLGLAPAPSAPVAEPSRRRHEGIGRYPVSSQEESKVDPS